MSMSAALDEAIAVFAYTDDAQIWAAYPAVSSWEDARTDEMDCLPMSCAFQLVLDDVGLDGLLVNGTDGNDGDVWTHWWVRVGDVNVDWTARQFWNLPGLPIPPDDIACPLIWRGTGHPLVHFDHLEVKA